MAQHTFEIAPGVLIEHVGQEALAILPESTSVMKVSAEHAHLLRMIEAGQSSEVSAESVQSLIAAGIVVSHTGLSRRGLIKAGVIGAGAGIAVMAMPTAAAASSGGGGGGDEPDFRFSVVLPLVGSFVNEVEMVPQVPPIVIPDTTIGTLARGGSSAEYRYFTSTSKWSPTGAPSLPNPPETLVFTTGGVTYRGVLAT